MDIMTDFFAPIGILMTCVIVVLIMYVAVVEIKDKYHKYRIKKSQSCDFDNCKYCKQGHCFDYPDFCDYNFLKTKDELNMRSNRNENVEC